MVLSSRSQRGVAGTISWRYQVKPQLDPLRQRSAPPWGLVCSAIMPFAESSAGCSSELERMATELAKSGWIHRAPSRYSLSDIDT